MLNPARIMVVDDERDFARGLARLLRARFPEITVEEAYSGEEALVALDRNSPGVMVSDLRMPGLSGLDLLARALAREPDLSVVILTGHGTIELAVQAVKSGAYDFLTKPVEPENLYPVMTKCLERARLLAENRRMRQFVTRSEPRHHLVGESPALRRLKETIAAVASTDYTVLLRGESGTGKELVAWNIHRLSRRAHREMIPVNCPAIPDQLLESELFGHAKGAFTGADRERKGLVLRADRGTLFLDEIGDVSPGIQTKLLRLLQEQEIRAVGSSASVKTDVRVIASTNRDLEAKMRDHSFREDLFYRLNVLSIELPAVKDRLEDVPLLLRHFLALTCREMKVPLKEITPETLAFLTARPWPGNVREIVNYVRRLVVFCPKETIDMNLIRTLEKDAPTPTTEARLISYRDAKAYTMREFTNRYVRELLQQTKGNISQAARLSGLERVSLQKILRRLGIEAKEFDGR